MSEMNGMLNSRMLTCKQSAQDYKHGIGIGMLIQYLHYDFWHQTLQWLYVSSATLEKFIHKHFGF